MKAQEEHNKMLQNTMDQVMGYLSQVTGHSGSSPMEGKGSNFAGNAVTTPHPHTSNVDKQYYTPPHRAQAQLFQQSGDLNSRHAQHNHFDP